jgi:hypothetical protein
MGNAPTADASIFVGFFRNVTAYYLAGTTGWAEFATNTGALIAPWNSPNPQVLTTGPDFGVRNNSFGFTISGGTNLSVVVEACTNLNERIWSPVATNNLTNGSFYFSEPLQGSAGERFYRISSQ